METLSAEEARKVMQIQEQLGVTTPRGESSHYVSVFLCVGFVRHDSGTIMSEHVRTVTLHKETQSTRLGIIFHQNTPEELATDVDKTPRQGGGKK